MVTTNETTTNWFTSTQITMSYLVESYNKQIILSVILLSLVTLSGYVRGELLTGTDDVAQLPFWEWRSQTISVRLVQRLPDQSRAYFTARGFSKEHAEMIAQSCVFQTIYKNTARSGSKHFIEYDLSEWKIITGEKKYNLKMREQWMQQWEKLGVSTKAKVAFKWSLLPTQQSYKAQDYNWGMTLYGLPPASKFDLLMVWTENGVEKSVLMKNLQCAPDVHLDPKDPFG